MFQIRIHGRGGQGVVTAAELGLPGLALHLGIIGAFLLAVVEIGPRRQQ